MPEDYPEYLHIGYSAVDERAISRALEVLTGRTKLPDRSDVDAYFKLDEQVRGTLHHLFRRP